MPLVVKVLCYKVIAKCKGQLMVLGKERPHIVELNLAQNYQGQRRYVQVLLSKPNQNRMKILRIIYPFENWQWDYQSGDMIVKCR